MSETLPAKKPWYLSKTLWSNFVLGVLVFVIPDLGEIMTEETLATVFAGVNFLLRIVTKEGLSLS